MSEQNKLPEEEQVERFTLTDEEGNEIEFELIGKIKYFVNLFGAQVHKLK